MLRPISVFALVGCLVSASLPTYAQSLSDLEEVLKNHPSLKVMEYQAAANREAAIASTALPDPVISFGINNFPVFDPSFTDFMPTNKSIGIQQKIPNREGQNARADQALAQAIQSDELEAQRFSWMRGELIAQIFEIERIRQQVELAQARREKYDELAKVVESEIDAGRPALFRLAEIESERAEVSRVMVELEGQKAQIDAYFTDLLGMIPVTTAPDLSPIDWNGEAREFHAVRVAEAAVQIREHSVEGAKAAWKPEWGAQLTYQQREAGANFKGDDFVSGTVTFTVPLWASKNQEPRLRAAKADREAARANLMAIARSSSAQYSNLNASRLTAQNTKVIYSQKIAAIQDKIASKLTVYEAGVGDYSPIIDGEIAILKLRAEIAAEDARLGAATARMNALLVVK